MYNNLSTAFSLLIIGMTSVFVVLTLIVITSRFLIRIVNALHIEVKENISKRKLAAIATSIDFFTEGKGKITKIEKY